ncbi:MAG: DUF3617 family protein [Xanthobacteraceae bacterium]
MNIDCRKIGRGRPFCYSLLAVRHSLKCRGGLFAVVAGILTLSASIAFADGIEAGLWKITTTVDTGGMTGPSHQSSKCLTAEQVHDLPATFSPIATTINSTCGPMQRSFDGTTLNWHLVCKGQVDMELTGLFRFDSAHHYTGTVQSKASLAGQSMPESKSTVEGQWLSACPQ